MAQQEDLVEEYPEAPGLHEPYNHFPHPRALIPAPTSVNLPSSCPRAMPLTALTPSGPEGPADFGVKCEDEEVDLWSCETAGNPLPLALRLERLQHNASMLWKHLRAHLYGNLSYQRYVEMLGSSHHFDKEALLQQLRDECAKVGRCLQEALLLLDEARSNTTGGEGAQVFKTTMTIASLNFLHAIVREEKFWMKKEDGLAGYISLCEQFRAAWQRGHADLLLHLH